MTIFRRKPVHPAAPLPVGDRVRTRRSPGDTTSSPARSERRESAVQNPQGVDADFCYRDDERI